MMFKFVGMLGSVACFVDVSDLFRLLLVIRVMFVWSFCFMSVWASVLMLLHLAVNVMQLML